MKSTLFVDVSSVFSKQYTGGANQARTAATYGTLDSGNTNLKNVHFFFCYCKQYTGQTGTGYVYFQGSANGSSWVNLSTESFYKSSTELIKPLSYNCLNTNCRYFRVYVDFSNMTDGAVSINIVT